MTCYAQVLSLTSARSLSDAEKAQRESCESSLDIAQQKWRQVRTWLSPDGRSLENGMPWNRILPLIPYYKSRREQGFVENSGVSAIGYYPYFSSTNLFFLVLACCYRHGEQTFDHALCN